MFLWHFLGFSMIQRMSAIWALVPLPFLNALWTSRSSQFMYCWSLAWRILSITLLVCSRWVQVFFLFPHHCSRWLSLELTLWLIMVKIPQIIKICFCHTWHFIQKYLFTLICLLMHFKNFKGCLIHNKDSINIYLRIKIIMFLWRF